MKSPDRNSENRVQFRAAGFGDNHHLLDIDLKSYVTPWTHDQWRWATDNCTCTVATVDERPIGMLIAARYEGDLLIARLAVKPQYRRNGFATHLLRIAYNHARNVGAPCLVMAIPETRICPGQDEDLSHWLSGRGFKAKKELIPDLFRDCGYRINGVEFYLPVRGPHESNE